MLFPPFTHSTFYTIRNTVSYTIKKDVWKSSLLSFHTSFMLVYRESIFLPLIAHFLFTNVWFVINKVYWHAYLLFYCYSLILVNSFILLKTHTGIYLAWTTNFGFLFIFSYRISFLMHILDHKSHQFLIFSMSVHHFYLT